MGRDKATLRLARRSLLSHARQSARALNLPVRVIRRDRIVRCGPLGGIYTALKSNRAGAVLFLACDMPFITPALIRRLIRSLRIRDAASFVTLKRRVGFPFIIRTCCGALVKKEILLGRLSLQELAVALKARRLPMGLSQSAALFNINTPEDLAAARRGRAR
jgi:molybdenum cofactor guanylyltransferase